MAYGHDWLHIYILKEFRSQSQTRPPASRAGSPSQARHMQRRTIDWFIGCLSVQSSDTQGQYLVTYLFIQLHQPIFSPILRARSVAR